MKFRGFPFFAKKTRGRILLANLKSGVNIPEFDKSGLSDKFILDMIQMRIVFDKVAVDNNLLLESILLIDYIDGWEVFESKINELLEIMSINSKSDSWALSYKIFNLLCRFGSHEIGEKILIKHKDFLKLAYFDGSLYFSAIGHLSQLWWLVELKELTGEPRDVIFVVNREYISNSFFAEKLTGTVRELGWKVFFDDDVPTNHQSYYDLECVTSGDGNKIIRRYLGSKISDRPSASNLPRITLEKSEEEKSLEILADWKIDFDGSDKFVGLHLRNGGDPFSGGRNASISKYSGTLDVLGALGYKVFLVGDENQSRQYSSLENENVINLAVRKSYEREIVQNFVWAKATFFIGNLSGGTFPAAPYGTPILWTDFYPLRHFRPFSSRDLLVPKIVMDSAGTQIDYARVMKSGKTIYDTECLPLLSGNNLVLVENSIDDINMAILDMDKQLSSEEELFHYGDQMKVVENYYAKLNLVHGAKWSPSFLKSHVNLIIE
jgi:putative glycosyltransferase (TIGR04372 family)